jgi:HD-like signal output (HDOD) protein
MDPQLERRLVACPTLPTLPAVALELVGACRPEAVDLQRVARILSGDPALAARTLALANSAAYGWGEVRTLTRAVTLLGARAVMATALTFSLLRGRRRGGAHGFDHDAFWRRALYSAVGARALAERWHLDSEEALLGGLIQDIGALALVALLRDEYGAIWSASQGRHATLSRLERERWGASHAEVGFFLTRLWNLPVSLQRSTLHSHALPPADSPGRQGLSECVYLSGLLADIWLTPHPADAVQDALDAARGELGMKRDAFALVLARAAALIPEMAIDFDVDLGDGDQLVTEARALLAARGIPPEPGIAGAGGPGR